MRKLMDPRLNQLAGQFIWIVYCFTFCARLRDFSFAVDADQSSSADVPDHARKWTEINLSLMLERGTGIFLVTS